MSLAWMGRRAARWLLALGLLAVLVYALGKPQTPRVGFATAVAGVPVNRTAPPLTGDLRLGATLTCGRGVWDDPATSPYSYAFQWVRDNQDLTGETKTPHTLPASDIGRAIRCDVTATGDSGIREANSVTYYPPAPSALTPPRISGDLRLGRTLSCTRATWNDDGLPAYATNIAWYRSGDPIPGATNATRLLELAQRLPDRAEHPHHPRDHWRPAARRQAQLLARRLGRRGHRRLRRDQAVAARRPGD